MEAAHQKAAQVAGKLREMKQDLNGLDFSELFNSRTELLYCFVMNSVAHSKRMNRDTTSESIIHSKMASMWEVRYVRAKDYREDPAYFCCHRPDGESVDRNLP